MNRFLLILLLFTLANSSSSAEQTNVGQSNVEQFSIDQLQGAWWAQEPSPTVAFAIQGNEAWFDYDSKNHPVKVENNILIFDHGPELGLDKSKIISVSNGRLVLQSITYPSEPKVYTLAEPNP